MILLIFTFFSILCLYIYTLTNTVYGGDAGDLVSAILTKGFPHPPGYPLYTLIGRMFLNFPINYLTAAGKVTLISSISTVCSFILIYLILIELVGKKINKPIAIVTILTLSVNYLIWLYAIVPEVFPLNVAITLGIFFSALRFKNTGNLNWLAFILFLIGLGITHHHTFIFILPAVFILTKNQVKKTFFSFRKIIYLLFSLLIGLLPLIYLPISFNNHPEIIWGEANTIKGFIAILTRQTYGSFVPGQFISNSPIHRLIQLVNLNNFIIADFTLVGYLAIIIGLIVLYRAKIIEKQEKISLFLALILFGPFFTFYANFPLYNKFLLATVERFFIIFYFLLAVPLYFGLSFLFEQLISLFKIIFGNRYKIFLPFIIIVFYLFPIALCVKNYRRLVILKNYSVAEKLGKDILNITGDNSIILLYSDTTLFNTQYMYYSNKKLYLKKILIHISKITSKYYLDSLKLNYPKIIIKNTNNYNLGNFINDNINNFNIYSVSQSALPPTFKYRWIFQGLLFKLVPKDYNNDNEIIKNIESFWNTAENKNISSYFLSLNNYWLNYFPNDVLQVYSTAHQNTAFYYLGINKPELALSHIKQALILNPEDLDSLFLQSVYYSKINNCTLAEKSIIQALNKEKDGLYIFQLEQLSECYKDELSKDRIRDIIKKFSDQSLKKLVN